MFTPTFKELLSLLNKLYTGLIFGKAFSILNSNVNQALLLKVVISASHSLSMYSFLVTYHFLVRSVHVGLEVSEEVEGILFVSYVVTQASWSSSYDVRVFTKDKAMKASGKHWCI